jgi:hypothetical protein
LNADVVNESPGISDKAAIIKKLVEKRNPVSEMSSQYNSQMQLQ